jgi:hypothetical protein
VHVSLERPREYYNWARANDVVATFHLSQPDSRYEVLGLELADVEFLLTELPQYAPSQTRAKEAKSLLSDLTDEELVSVLSEVFIAKRGGDAV